MSVILFSVKHYVHEIMYQSSSHKCKLYFEKAMLHGDFRSKSFYPLLTLLNTFILNDLKLAFLYKLYFSCECLAK